MKITKEIEPHLKGIEKLGLRLRGMGEREGAEFRRVRSAVLDLSTAVGEFRERMRGGLPGPTNPDQGVIDFTPPPPTAPAPSVPKPARPHKTVLPHQAFHPFDPQEFARVEGTPRFSASGLGIGDVLFAVPAVKALGGGEFYVTCFNTCFSWSPQHPFTNESYRARTYHNLAAFLETQPYITKCAAVDYDPTVYYDVDFDNVRHTWHRVVNGSISLLELYQDYVGGTLDLSEPWLTPPDERYPDYEDAVVINVNDRRVCELDLRVLADYEHVVLLGLKREWDFFQAEWGIDAEHYEARDFFDMASLMESCRLFVGCSSSPIVIADGLNVDRIYCQWNSKPFHQSVGGDTITVSTDEQLVDALLDRGIL